MCEFFADSKSDSQCDSSHVRCSAKVINLAAMRTTSDREYREAAAKRLRAAREAQGYSNADLCRLLNIAPTRLTSWEKGGALPNTPRLWALLADALDVTTDYILLGRTTGLSRELYARLNAPKPDGE
jgi:ribosome-binding protein aMBF1 (putative translation factor)